MFNPFRLAKLTLSHSNLILCLMKIFPQAVNSTSIRVGLNVLCPAALNSRAFRSKMTGKPQTEETSCDTTCDSYSNIQSCSAASIVPDN